TTAADTQGAVKQLCEQGIDLLLFAGGDGTARDVMDTLQRAGRADTLPVGGIPAGCKIHSAVYAITPKRAGELVALLAGGSPMSLVAAQVMDLDESLFRQGEVKSRCYGYLQTPVDDTRMQLTKQGGVNNEAEALEEIAAEVVDTMEEGVLYIIGSGSTTQAIMQQLGLANTLLGVDVVFNHQLLENDVTEERLLTLLDSPDYAAVRIIVTVIGGQGFVFGRGNQQISAEVIRRVGVENITIVATSEKLRTLGQRGLLVDTGNEAMDNQLRGLRPVITGYEQKTLVTIG
ncbi:MAG TPA: ATP-NAD kinase, partial [Thiotrichales bacterium]|nr:ATP-NAD kinase [Thiotrichales bacterium]